MSRQIRRGIALLVLTIATGVISALLDAAGLTQVAGALWLAGITLGVVGLTLIAVDLLRS